MLELRRPGSRSRSTLPLRSTPSSTLAPYLQQALTSGQFSSSPFLFRTRLIRRYEDGLWGHRYEFCQERDIKPWPHQTAYHSVEPYLSIPGKILRERLAELEDRVVTSIWNVGYVRREGTNHSWRSRFWCRETRRLT